MGIISGIEKYILDRADPICQSRYAKLCCRYGKKNPADIDFRATHDISGNGFNPVNYATYNYVRLVPCIDRDTSRIYKWTPDPKQVKELGLESHSSRFEMSPLPPCKSVFSAIPILCGGAIARLLDTVGDEESVNFGKYKGHLVRFVPVINGHCPRKILEWIPDPEECKRLDRLDSIIASEDGGHKHGRGKPLAKNVPKNSLIIVDGSNVICSGDEKCGYGVRGTKVLSSLVNSLIKDGYQCRVLLDGSMIGRLKYKEHDEEGLSYLKDAEKKRLVTIAPGKAEADGQILQLAQFEKSSHIITNDKYRDYEQMYPWLKDTGPESRLHGINIVSMEDSRYRVLVAGFNLDISVQS